MRIFVVMSGTKRLVFTLLIIIEGYSESIVKNFFFPEALTRKSKTNAYMEHLL